MTTLSIEIPLLDGGKPEPLDQRIMVTHLHARRLAASEMRIQHPPQPGMVILLPQSDSFTLVVDHKPRLMIPGIALLLAGQSEWTLRPSSARETDENQGEMMGLIELNALINGAIPLPELLETPARLAQIPSEDIARLFDMLLDSRQSLVLSTGSPDVVQHLAAAQLVATLLAAARRDRAPANQASTDPQLLKLKTFMMKNLNRSPSIEDMARHMGVSRSGFYRWSKPLFEGSPVQYLRKLRLEKSQELLRNPAFSIDQIAEMTGFNSRYHLGREFVKHYHITPAQWRRTTRLQSTSDPIGDVENLIRRQCFEEALAACRKNLANPALGKSRHDIHHQMALCLYALGRMAEAVDIWERLRESSRAYPASQQLCSHYYRCESHDRVVAILADLYPQVNDRQRQELIMTWCHQVAGLIDRQRPGPIPLYLEIRRKFFPADLRSMSVTADALIGLGREHLVVEECPEMRDMHVYMLRRAGLHRRALEGDYHPDREVVLSTLNFAGEYERVLDLGADYPGFMAGALARLGRPEEAIQRYPDHCQDAYLVLGRYRELLERWPEPSEYQVLALAGLKEKHALRHYPKPIAGAWELAQFILGPDHFFRAVPGGRSRLQQCALLWKAIQCLRAGKRAEADSYLKRIPQVQSDRFWCRHDGSCHEVILTTVTRGLTGAADLMASELKKIVTAFKYTDWQIMWHDAAFLTANIDLKVYRKQPCQARLRERLAVVQTLDKELKGAASPQPYQSLLRQLDDLYLLDKPHLREFIAWRIQALQMASQRHNVQDRP